jgi:hypothetical protein
VQIQDDQGNILAEARIAFEDAISYTHIDRLSHISTPSDPRHMVHSTAFKIEIISGELS